MIQQLLISYKKVYSGYLEDTVISKIPDLKWRVLGINNKGEIEFIKFIIISN